MRKLFKILCFLCVFSLQICYGEKVIWKGEVNSDGTPSKLISLELHKNYQIKVSGFVKLGKWVQEGEPLANDACFEFGKDHEIKFESLLNSNNISVCNDKYSSEHKYQSAVFSAKQDRIHFWVNDTVYEDNHGTFEVEVVQVD